MAEKFVGKKKYAGRYFRPIPDSSCGFCCHHATIASHPLSLLVCALVSGGRVDYVRSYCVFYRGSFYCKAACQKALVSVVLVSASKFRKKKVYHLIEEPTFASGVNF